jgi:GNAT superfamily N-acetyltransferase
VTLVHVLEIRRDRYLISTDAAKLDLNVVYRYLSETSYWAKNRPHDVVRRSIAHSLCFGVYEDGAQVGFARVVTDYATFAWLCDVFILDSHQGRGLGKWLLETVLAHPELRGVSRFLLATRDAHELYRRYGGFELLPNPERWMIRTLPKPAS